MVQPIALTSPTKALITVKVGVHGPLWHLHILELTKVDKNFFFPNQTNDWEEFFAGFFSDELNA